MASPSQRVGSGSVSVLMVFNVGDNPVSTLLQVDAATPYVILQELAREWFNRDQPTMVPPQNFSNVRRRFSFSLTDQLALVAS